MATEDKSATDHGEQKQGVFPVVHPSIEDTECVLYQTIHAQHRFLPPLLESPNTPPGNHLEDIASGTPAKIA